MRFVLRIGCYAALSLRFTFISTRCFLDEQDINVIDFLLLDLHMPRFLVELWRPLGWCLASLGVCCCLSVLIPTFLGESSS